MLDLLNEIQSRYKEVEHDDIMTADDYDHKAYQRDGWEESKYDRQRW